MPVWLITGCSRGIGLGFVKALKESPENAILATCRSPEVSEELREIADASEDLINVVPLNQDKRESIEAAATTAEELLGDLPVDYIINNAAYHPGFEKLDEIDRNTLTYTFSANVVGPVMVYQVFKRFLDKSERPVVVNISSGAGSIGMDLGPSASAYSISKAALNMMTYKLAKENPKLITVAMSPGWVKTDMGGPGAQIEVADSVQAMLRVIQNLKSTDSGAFLNREGKNLPW